MPFIDNFIILTTPKSVSNNGKLVENYGSYGFQYTLVSPEGEIVAPWMTCKDYIQDLYQAAYLKESCSIYGLQWNPKEFPNIGFDAARIAIRMISASDKELENFKNEVRCLVTFLNLIEDIMGISRSIGCFVKDQPNTYYIQSGIRWLRHPVMVNLWGFLMRVGLFHKEGRSWEETLEKFAEGQLGRKRDNDPYYLKSSLSVVKAIILSSGSMFSYQLKKNWIKQNIQQVHDNCGIMNFSVYPASSISVSYDNKELREARVAIELNSGQHRVHFGEDADKYYASLDEAKVNQTKETEVPVNG